ncbi:MAG: nitrogen fixation protein NifZ [Rhodospirillaceae bacterium]|nr:nitrogen fixation protein NifZ [Rhodospirillaceae bacterium]
MIESESLEVDTPPLFQPGQKVRAAVAVRSDGSYMGAATGDVLIEAGAVGYIRGMGEFLQRHRIYAVDFFEHARIVGMRAHELELLED